MVKMKITIGTEFAWTYGRILEMDDFESHSQAVIDKFIDTLEAEGCERYFGSQEEIDNGELFDDEYIVGGNHCRILRHYGTLIIEEVEE